MALNPKLSAASRNLALNAALDVLNNGFFDIYDSTQPTDADTAVGAQVKLARCTFGATAWAAASAASKSANAITADSAADATGTAAWYRMWQSNGTTAVWDGTVGTASANLVVNTVAFQINANVSISSFSATMAA
jgi:hypothetical protein